MLATTNTHTHTDPTEEAEEGSNNYKSEEDEIPASKQRALLCKNKSKIIWDWNNS